MTYGYALQVAGVIAAMAAIGLTALKVASSMFDRQTRENAARDSAELARGREGGLNASHPCSATTLKQA